MVYFILREMRTLISKETSDIKKKLEYCEQMTEILGKETKYKMSELASMRAKMAYGESVDISDYTKLIGLIENLAKRSTEYSYTIKYLSSGMNFNEVIPEDFLEKINKRVDFIDVDFPAVVTPNTSATVSMKLLNVGMTAWGVGSEFFITISNIDRAYTSTTSHIVASNINPMEHLEVQGSFTTPMFESLYDIKIGVKDSTTGRVYDYPYQNSFIISD